MIYYNDSHTVIRLREHLAEMSWLEDNSI